MSARRIDELTPAGMAGAVVFDNSNLRQINQEVRKNFEGLEQDVKEAKTLVHQTQSKVEELASSIGKIQDTREESPEMDSHNDGKEPESGAAGD